MDVDARLASAEQKSHELYRSFSQLEHRVREFVELQETLKDFHSQIAELTETLQQLKHSLELVHQVLPSIARKEELDRFRKKLDTIPFELLANHKDLRHLHKT